MSFLKDVTSDDYLDTDQTEKLFETHSSMNSADSSSVLKGLKENTVLLWYVLLGHISKQYLKQASKFIPELQSVKFNSSIQNCEIFRRQKVIRTVRLQNASEILNL